MMIMHIGKQFLRIALLCCISSFFVFGQATPQKADTPPGSHQVSLPLLYHLFLAYQTHLDRAAAKLDATGKDGSELRNHFQQRLGFSDAEFGAVRATAQRLQTELQAPDSKARALINAAHAQAPRVLHGPEDAPPVPPELIQLQNERDAIIEREVAELKATLGAENAAKLDKLIQKEFAPNVTIKTAPPPLIRGSMGRELPSHPQEVR